MVKWFKAICIFWSKLTDLGSTTLAFFSIFYILSAFSKPTLPNIADVLLRSRRGLHSISSIRTCPFENVIQFNSWLWNFRPKSSDGNPSKTNICKDQGIVFAILTNMFNIFRQVSNFPLLVFAWQSLSITLGRYIDW